MKRLLGILLVIGSAAGAVDVKLVLNWKPEAEFGGFYAAELNGAYAKENLKVEILPGGVGTPAVQMVAAGTATFGIASADEVLMSQDRGSDVVALFAVYQTNPQGLMVRASRGVKKIQDLFGEGILAVQKGLPYVLFLEKKYGPMKAKVVPYLGGISQLAENPLVAQQCFITSEPLIAEKQKIPVKTFLIADAGFNPYTAVVVVKRSFAANNAETVAAFRRAIDAGWKDYLKSPVAANAVMNKLNPTMDLEALRKSAAIQKPLIENASTKTLGLGSMTDVRWMELGVAMKDLGLIKNLKAADQYYIK